MYSKISHGNNFHIEIMIMVNQQALQQEHVERAPRTADELSQVICYGGKVILVQSFLCYFFHDCLEIKFSSYMP